MKIAIIGPVATIHIAQFLEASPPENFPRGDAGAPFMATLIGELLRRGHEVVAITTGGLEAKPGVKPLSLRGPKFSFHCCPVRAHAVRWSHGRHGRLLDMYADERRHLLSVLDREDPDLVHAHWTYESAMAALSSGRPSLVTAHDDPIAVVRLSRSLFRLGRFFMALRVLRTAPRLTAVSSDLARRLGRLRRSPIDVITNPLTAHFIGVGVPRHMPEAGQELRIVTILNGWVAWKNAASAIRAFADFRRHWPSATLHMFGYDYEAGGVAERWARSRGLDAGITFAGSMTQARLCEELQAAHVLLHPSRLESCGMAIAEAMSLGVPVIGGIDSGAVAWMAGDAGLLVDVTSPKELTSALQALCADPLRYHDFSIRALERVREFSPSAVVDQYEKLYFDLLGSRARRPFAHSVPGPEVTSP